MAYRYDEEGKEIEKKDSYTVKTEEVVRVGWIERFFNNHVKVIAMLCTLLVVGACFWGIERLKESGVFEENKDYEGIPITMNVVIGLEDKPETLHWSDLKGFSYEELSRSYVESEGGKLYCARRYSLDNGEWTLLAGGFLEEEKGELEYAILKKNGSSDTTFYLHSGEDLLLFLRRNGYVAE